MLLYIVAKCHFFSVVTWKDIIFFLQKCERCTHFCEILYIKVRCSENVCTRASSGIHKWFLYLRKCLEIIHKCSDFEFAQCCRSGMKFFKWTHTVSLFWGSEQRKLHRNVWWAASAGISSASQLIMKKKTTIKVAWSKQKQSEIQCCACVIGVRHNDNKQLSQKIWNNYYI